jgi:hypothetical protein
MPMRIVEADSVTQLGDVAGAVLVAGSHGGVIAAYLGAKAAVHALILNDAGVGKDRAGIAGLVYLEELGMAAAAVDCMSARIGDGADMLARGVISHANVFAAICGVVAGQSCRDAAERLRRAVAPRAAPPPYAGGAGELPMARRRSGRSIRWAKLYRPTPAGSWSSVRTVRCSAAGRIRRSGSTRQRQRSASRTA